MSCARNSSGENDEADLADRLDFYRHGGRRGAGHPGARFRQTARADPRPYASISLTAWIFIGMAAGVALGILAPDFAKQLGLMSTVFLRLIRSIIAPLLFGTLVAGIAGGGDIKQMGRIGGKAILYFEIVTTFALFLGLAAVNLVRPGDGVPIARPAADSLAPAAPPTFAAVVEHTFPASIVDAFARNDVLQVNLASPSLG